MLSITLNELLPRGKISSTEHLLMEAEQKKMLCNPRRMSSGVMQVFSLTR